MNCHGQTPQDAGNGRAVVLVGNPNVGKSALFGRLTGRYVTVSNYPGTTVEIARGTLAVNAHRRPVLDTPGLHGLVALTDDERVTRDILLLEDAATTVQVADTKNLRRALLLSLELAEAGLPFILVLNMADEAAARGIHTDAQRLSEALGVPVVSTVATTGEGMDELAACLESPRPSFRQIPYDPALEEAAGRVSPLLPRTNISPRTLALLLLADDEALPVRLGLAESDRRQIRLARDEAEARLGQPVGYAVNQRRLEEADAILEEVVRREPAGRSRGEVLGRWAAHPVAGWPILLVALALMFLFVGVLGAGKLVNLLETRLFGQVINPLATRAVDAVVPVPVVRDFLVGRYGLITMALTYGLAIVLPIVTTFFLAFGVLEDSGYLPRLAVMLDRAFRVMGLNGRAVIPMILGLGCDTMATVTTRTLESRRERLQVTLLLALAVPCSAQLGVILGMISSTGAIGITIWAGIVVATLLGVGYISSRVIPGPRSDFIVELPPMRVPSARNIAVKTTARLEWYLKEVIPVFVLGTAALFALDRTGLLAGIQRALSPLIVRWLGLPVQATGAFLVGFLRRDYGAAGLYSLARAGALSPNQILVSLVVITLFIPCVANLMMIVKEHGRRTAAAVAAFVFPFAFLVGGLLNLALRALDLRVG